jgi:hypothetical protein
MEVLIFPGSRMTLTRGAGRQEQENGILAWLVVTLPDLAQNVLVKTPSVVAERFFFFLDKCFYYVATVRASST